VIPSRLPVIGVGNGANSPWPAVNGIDATIVEYGTAYAVTRTWVLPIMGH
jgi:hypothetical protein